LLKEDVLRYVEQAPEAEPAETVATGMERSGGVRNRETPAASEAASPSAEAGQAAPPMEDEGAERQEDVVPMSLIRRRIAATLVEAQHEAALLTTFNEIDMTEVIALRRRYRDLFMEKYQIKLGFMSFFVKAVIESLKEAPAINAEIRDRSIVYRNYFDVGIAIGGGKGLVVPILRNAERLSFAEIEQQIADFAQRAADNKIRPDELVGGTFTITNGGVYGSLLSTPIVNPPQSGVLGLHAIQERPVARDGQVVIRPMMYVALTYDHRIVDGREAVTFLKRLQGIIEEPARMLLEV
jgi:2-oxoglutarate dehydrogenase E2 component (dihydrolipoamide succinyltransferase)